MIEFKVKIRVNTQDPEIAYEHLRASLSYAGMDVVVADDWLRNNDPLPPDVAHTIARRWLASRRVPFDNNCVIATNDPVVSTELDAAARAKSHILERYDIESEIGFIKGESYV